MQHTPARILIVAGSDSGGGAGIQADIKTVTVLGGYAATAITALTAQNTYGVQAIEAVSPAFVAQQMRAVLEDIGADAIKTGMLFSAEIIEAAADVLADYPDIPLVLDPVMVAKGGAALLKPDAIAALRHRLLPRAMLLTPNIPEAELLTGLSIATPEDMVAAGRRLLAEGPQAVLMKGGHLDGDTCIDLLVTPGNIERFESNRLKTKRTHGTGCSLASAIACHLGQGLPLPQAVEAARNWLQGAIAHAPHLGGGHGPIGHGWRWGDAV